MAGKPGRSGGARPGSGRPMGAKNFRYKTSAELIEAARIDEQLIPVKFEGDSLAFLKATMEGKIWPTREQMYAAKSVLPIEYSPAVTVKGCIDRQQSIFLSVEYFEFEKRALRVLRKHPEVLADDVLRPPRERAPTSRTFHLRRAAPLGLKPSQRRGMLPSTICR